MIFSIVHDAVNPFTVVGQIGVDTGKAGSGATDTPANNAGKDDLTVGLVTDQRSPGITLAGIAFTTSGAEHARSDVAISGEAGAAVVHGQDIHPCLQKLAG